MSCRAVDLESQAFGETSCKTIFKKGFMSVVVFMLHSFGFFAPLISASK